MDVERSLLTKVVQTGEIRALFDARITRSYFQDDEHALIAKWLYDFWDHHGKAPGEEALKHEYPQWKLAKVPEPLPYYIEKLKEERKYFILQDTLEEALKTHKEVDNAGTIAALTLGLEFLHEEVSELTDEDYTQTTEARLAYYKNLSDHDGLIGIPTGFPTLDNELGGYQDGQLITWVGPPKSGKSSMMMKSAIAAHEAGNRPFFASFEMSNIEQQARADVLRAGISYKRLLHGKLLPKEIRKLEQSMKYLADMPPFWFVHDPSAMSNISSLRARIMQHKPNIVFVDGVYLMDVEIDADPGSPQALTYLTRNFKRLAQDLGVPIVISTQVLLWKMRKKTITSDSIGYSSSFAQDSDVIIGVEPPADPADQKNVTVRIVDARSAARREIGVSFDWDEGSITEYEGEDTDGADGSADDDL